jgi:hypothetical protein
MPLLALADASREELEHNRQLLEQAKNDPEHYERLQRDLRAFLALPPDRQAQLRELDHDLHDEESTISVRSQRILQRYARWLQSLTEPERQRIKGAHDNQQRLQIIKELRDRQWVNQLPAAVQEDLHKLPDKERALRVAELRTQDRQRREEWRLAIRNWDEILYRPYLLNLQVLKPEVKFFVTESLMPLLGEAEKNRLLKAQDQWPLFPQVLVQLADNHPIRLPGVPKKPVRQFDDLPESFKQKHPKVRDAFKKSVGQWPEYAIAVANRARNQNWQLEPLGPATLADFGLPVQQFCQHTFSEAEKAQLKEVLGKWPEFPQTIAKLGRDHKVPVPGTFLPGPRFFWDKFRITATASAEPLPEVPDEVLLDFVRQEMTPEERATLPSSSLADSTSREQAKQMFFNKNQAELQKRRQADQKAIATKKPPAVPGKTGGRR